MKKFSTKTCAASLNTDQILKVTGISQATLKEYQRLGLVTPAFPAEKKGQKHFYNFQNAIMIKFIKMLSNANVARDVIRPMVLFAEKTVHPLVSENPFQLSFSKHLTKDGKITELDHVVLRLIDMDTFWIVGTHNYSKPNSVLFFEQIKKGEKIRRLALSEMTAIEKEDFNNALKGICHGVTIELNTTKAHFEIRGAMEKMGII